MSRKFTWTLLIAMAVSGIAACSGDNPPPTPSPIPTVEPSANPTPTPTPQIVIEDDGAVQFTVYLSVNGSQQTGTAVFTQQGNVVDLRVDLSPSAPVQMMSLRSGECPGPGVFELDLDPLVGGSSVQKIRNYGMGRLTSGDLMLIVSASNTALRPVAGCADLPQIGEEHSASR